MTTFYNVPPFQHFLNQTGFDFTQPRPSLECKWYAYNRGVVTIWDTEAEATSRSSLVEKLYTPASMEARRAYDYAYAKAHGQAVINWKKCVIENIEAEFKFILSEQRFDKLLMYIAEYTVDIGGTYDEHSHQIKILCEMLTDIGNIWNA